MAHTKRHQEQIDQLNKEIDQLRNELAQTAPTSDPSPLHSILPDGHKGFYNKLKRHHDLTSEEFSPELSDLSEAIVLVNTTALNIYNDVADKTSKLGYKRKEAAFITYEQLASVKDYIDQNLDKELSVTDLAERACISSYHFLRLFKQAYSETPYQYILLKRLEKSCSLLRETTLPIMEIAYQCGFQNNASFSLVFKRNFGITPKEYRQSA